MGNSGSQPVTTPPPSPMPIEDSIAAKSQAAALVAQRAAGASRDDHNLNDESSSKAEAVTRGQLAKGESFQQQAQPTGPAGPRPRSPRRVAPGSSMASSAIITG